MSETFADRLKRLRTQKNISQKQLADMLYVDRSTVASWETGRRTPDAAMLARIAACLGVDAGELLTPAAENRRPNVILLDDERILLSGCLPVLQKAMPNADIHGFQRSSEAIAYARKTRVDLAFLDIELGAVSGFDVCRELLEINPNVNVIYLTAYMDYSFDAWDTGACGFLLKPLSETALNRALTRLRHPLNLR